MILPAITAQPVSIFGAPIVSPAAAPVAVPGSSFGMNYAAGASSASAAGSVSSLVNALPAQTVGAAISVPAPFADLLSEALGQVQEYESEAKSAVEGMMTGKGVDVHQAMIATEKAESGFELMLAVRNKALAAYQQVMGMQF